MKPQLQLLANALKRHQINPRSFLVKWYHLTSFYFNLQHSLNKAYIFFIFVQLDKYYKALIPNDVMAFNDTVDQIKVDKLVMDPIKNSFHVLISEVQNPSFFWVTLCKNRKKISHLMNKLQ